MLIGGALLVVLVQSPPSQEAHRPANPAVKSDSFVAATTNCRTEDIHSWTYPAGYIRGQVVACEIQSENTRVNGRLELQVG